MSTQSYGWRSIRLRLFVLFAAVIAAVLFYAGREFNSQWQVRGSMERGLQYSELAVQINGVVHELQKERGLSAGFIASRATRFKSELSTQHTYTNTARSALDSWLAASARERLESSNKAVEEARSELAKLDATRAQISALKLAGADSFNYYSASIERLTRVLEIAVAQAAELELARGMNAYLMFVLAKEQAGRERASINGLFAANVAADVKLHRRIITILTAQDTYLANFRSVAPSAWVHGLNTVLDSSSGRETAQLRQIALERMELGDFGVEPTQWFAAITQKINLLKVEEDRIADALLERARALSGDATQRLALSIAMGAAVALAALLFSLQLSSLLRGLRNNPPPRTHVVDRFFDLSTHPQTLPPSVAQGVTGGPDAEGQAASLVELLQAQTSRMASMEDELEAARRTLHERKVIERAKGVLMARLGMNEDVAFRVLQKTSMDQNRRLVDVAEATLSLPDLAFALPAVNQV